MCSFQLFLSADPSLGKVDYSLFSDQTLMEMFVDGFDDEARKENQDNDGTYLDVCTWSCITCDDDERVTQIHMNNRDISHPLETFYVPPNANVANTLPWLIRPRSRRIMTGSVDLTHLPERTQILNLENNNLTGEIDLTQLPDRMKCLNLGDNRLTGEIDLTHLPDGMAGLFLSNNQLSGEIDLAHLPKSMLRIVLNDNQLSGGIDLTHLPEGMLRLSLENNQLSGEIDLTHLPEKLQALVLENNQLTGSLVAKKLPQRGGIDLRGNHFNALAVVDSKTYVDIKLEGSGVTSVVDENGGELHMRRFL